MHFLFNTLYISRTMPSGNDTDLVTAIGKINGKSVRYCWNTAYGRY